MLSLIDKLTVVNKIIKENPDVFIIMENSVISDLHVHAKYLLEMTVTAIIKKKIM